MLTTETTVYCAACDRTAKADFMHRMWCEECAHDARVERFSTIQKYESGSFAVIEGMLAEAAYELARYRQPCCGSLACVCPAEDPEGAAAHLSRFSVAS